MKDSKRRRSNGAGRETSADLLSSAWNRKMIVWIDRRKVRDDRETGFRKSSMHVQVSVVLSFDDCLCSTKIK